MIDAVPYCVQIAREYFRPGAITLTKDGMTMNGGDWPGDLNIGPIDGGELTMSSTHVIDGRAYRLHCTWRGRDDGAPLLERAVLTPIPGKAKR